MGQVAGLIDEELSAAEIMESIMTEYNEVIKEMTN